MNKVNYTRLAKSAKRLIDRFGSEVTFVVNSTTNAGQAWKPQTNTPTEIVTTGVFIKEKNEYRNGELIQTAKEKILFYKVDGNFDVNLTGYIKRGSEKWKFSNIKPINPGAVIIMYSAEVTR